MVHDEAASLFGPQSYNANGRNYSTAVGVLPLSLGLTPTSNNRHARDFRKTLPQFNDHFTTKYKKPLNKILITHSTLVSGHYPSNGLRNSVGYISGDVDAIGEEGGRLPFLLPG
jgi:hypothetical protein